MKRVFIDGSAGTTGLRIHDRISMRKDLEVLTLSEETRKDPAARQDAINTSDIVFLCLPDAAAEEAAQWVINPDTILIDTSTAHRTSPGWTYGFPELTGQHDKVAVASRIANPGCHASGVIALIRPLVETGMLDPEVLLSCFSLTGYSGGGKKMIEAYEQPSPDPLFQAPRVYGLTQQHKHIPEIVQICGLKYAPVFSPVVAPYYSGMEVAVPLHASMLNCPVGNLSELFREYYRDAPLISVAETSDSFISACQMAGRDDMQILIEGNQDRITLISLFDNLGKGASGAAIQNMNIVLDIPETTGLITGGKP